jgi:hypothetical protein
MTTQTEPAFDDILERIEDIIKHYKDGMIDAYECAYKLHTIVQGIDMDDLREKMGRRIII